jgi:hypothetical protein
MRWLRSMGVGLLLGVFCGCAGYKMGPTNGLPAGAKSIQVNLFHNNTIEPRLVEAVSSALRKQLQQDGTYRLATQDDGDIVVNGTIARFERSGLSYQPGDILTVRDYSLQIIARIVAKERGTGKVLLDREITGRTTIRTGSNLSSAERQAIPMIAEDFARIATSLLVDGPW